MKHPNILLITTDQQSATMMSCTGNPFLKTPALDALAADGVRFEKAYAAQPLCIPQRCSWYSGLMPHQHGLTSNVNEWELRSETMMGQIFRDAGYATGYSGKWHVNVPFEDKDRHGFEWMSNLLCNGADEGITPDFKRFLGGDDTRPFLFSASFNNPHNICEAARGGPFPDGNPGMVENLEQLPPLPDNFAVPEGEPSIIREVQRKYGKNNYPVARWDEMRWRLHGWHYHRLVELVDRRIGELMQVLEQSGCRDDTLIVFTSDHGDGGGHHRWNQKQVLYDESARVPFMVVRPGGGAGRVDDEQLINTGIDLIPTLCGLAEIECPDHLAGCDWSPALSGSGMPQMRDHVVVETEFGTFGKPMGCMGRAVRTARFKYMVYDTGENREFFVDMERDPGETVNLAGTLEYRDELKRHRKLLCEYVNRTDDVFPMAAIPDE